MPEALRAVTVPTLRGDFNEDEEGAEVGPASAIHPCTGAMESVAPPVNPVSRTWATPVPVAAVTTRTGSPSATPIIAVSTSLRALAGSGAEKALTAVPTIFDVDTSAWKRGPRTPQTGSAAPSGRAYEGLTSKPRISIDPVVRVNRSVKRWVENPPTPDTEVPYATFGEPDATEDWPGDDCEPPVELAAGAVATVCPGDEWFDKAYPAPPPTRRAAVSPPAAARSRRRPARATMLRSSSAPAGAPSAPTPSRSSGSIPLITRHPSLSRSRLSGTPRHPGPFAPHRARFGPPAARETPRAGLLGRVAGRHHHRARPQHLDRRHDGRDLLGRRFAVGHRGTFPCLRLGSSSRLVRRRSKLRDRTLRVSAGSITSST